MTRKECLEQAMGCVLRDRQNQYGGPENNFERIAQMWNGYLGTNAIKPWDVAAMMGMLKMARARFNPKYADNWVDMAGYAACGIECATAQEEFDKALDEAQKKSMEHMFKKAEPEFQRGDKVQAFNGEEWVDCRYIRWKEPEGRHVVQYKGCMCAIDPENLRPVSRAEGCEALVEKDAPQTREELYSKILESNPATFKARTPTGEELAEMAEEEPHG